MNTVPCRHSLLGVCLANSLLLLTACGGGGGGMVRPTPTPIVVSPPPVSGNVPCSSATADCILVGTQHLVGGRTSTGALIKQDGWSELYDGTFTFAGGTRIEGGALLLFNNAVLVSNVEVRPHSSFVLSGTVRGTVANSGVVDGGQFCDIDTLNICYAPVATRVQGDYRQTADAKLRLALGMPFNVTGRADIDGYLELWLPISNYPSEYVLPTVGSSHLLMRAGNGIFGAFQAISLHPFLDGKLRYTTNDLYFDVSRASLQVTMNNARAGSAITLASAGNLDRAFQRADLFALMPRDSLTSVQRKFLESSASIQHIDSFGQAVASLDSLSGRQQADTLQHLAQHQALPASATAWRLDRMQPGRNAGGWSALDGSSVIAGLDQWLGPRVLAGSRVTSGAGGPGAAGYLRGFGEGGWYVGGELGFARHAIALSRIIDLGPGGLWGAHSRRNLDITQLRLEGGRQLSVGGGTLTPFASLDAVSLRGGGMLEQGETGFELALQPNSDARLFAGAGLRYNRDWQVGGSGWLRLQAGTGYLRQLARDGDPLRAAFLGIPDLWFEVPVANQAGNQWHALGLQAGGANGWTWSLDYSQQWQGAPARPDWWLGVRRVF